MDAIAGQVSCDELAGGIAAGFSGINVAQAAGLRTQAAALAGAIAEHRFSGEP